MYWLASGDYWKAEERDGQIRSRATVERLSKSYRVHVVTDAGFTPPIDADPTHSMDLGHYRTIAHCLAARSRAAAKQWAEEEIARQLRIMKQWREES